MFWDLVTLLALFATWAFVSNLYKEVQQLRKDTDDMMMFNRISRYHALNDEVAKQKEEEDNEG